MAAGAWRCGSEIINDKRPPVAPTCQFSLFGRLHGANNSDGFWFFPQNQLNPDAEWGPSSWERRNHFGFYGAINPKHLLNLGVGVFAKSGEPYSINTGGPLWNESLQRASRGCGAQLGDGTGLCRPRPALGYDFKLNPAELDKSPTIGVSVASFNVLNHPNGSYVDSTLGSRDFGQVTSANPPRRFQMGMRMMF